MATLVLLAEAMADGDERERHWHCIVLNLQSVAVGHDNSTFSAIKCYADTNCLVTECVSVPTPI